MTKGKEIKFFAFLVLFLLILVTELYAQKDTAKTKKYSIRIAGDFSIEASEMGPIIPAISYAAVWGGAGYSGCDFVFDNKYKLMPLNDLEKYLQLNHHLPGIASAKEMESGDGVAKSVK